ncbi:MAG: DUF255 domain-containing protein [Chlorobia bacterium]|nr:DUF255 domain-containing protein [Fimbriimonadaceae bacterium]
MVNRLANETSPYLLQHQNNPVDWYPWGEEAFAKAKAQDKPVFLSVGYSSCHWCHVMEHESFEDSEIAELLNNHFVSVKVDREERPDVDETYMTAVQLSSGRGGWPMSVFLTPDKEPFFAGTYFPKTERGGHPGFGEILKQVSGVWANERSKVYDISKEYSEAIKASRNQTAPPTTSLGPDLLNDCVRAHSLDFDEDHGGFGQAPKFPPHTAIEFLLNYAISDFGDEELRQSAADMGLFTLEAMALGGIHDQVGGGFHRYATDERWLLPHFEKMLYDNASLLGNYARAAALCHEQLPELEALFAKAADGIVQWLRDEMTSPEGLFYSALDADSEGVEGKFYLWTEEEVDSILGPESTAFKASFQFHPDGNFREEATGHTTGANIPHLLETVGNRFDAALAKLRKARATRIRPGLDDKVLVGWNGLMIAALAETAELGLAERAAGAILSAEKVHGSLPHQIAKGKPSGEAFLEDYAYFIDGLLAIAGVKTLFQSEGGDFPGRPPEAWLIEAQRLAATMIDKFYDPENGGFYSTSERHEDLFGRSKPTFDQPQPSANAIAAKCLVELGDERRALQTVQSMAGWMERAPAATEALHLVLMSLLGEGVESQPEEVPFNPEPIASPILTVKLAITPLMAINGVAEGTLEILIPDGQHINSANPPARWLTPTEIKIQPLVHRIHYPEPTNDQYVGEVAIPFEVDLPAGVGAEEIELTVKYQVCTDSECLLPQEKRLSVLVQAT